MATGQDPPDPTAPPESDLGALLLEHLARPDAGEAGEQDVPPVFVRAGDVVVLVGALADPDGGGAGREQAVKATVRRAAADGLLSSARACGRGGLAVALARSCLHLGAALRVPFPAEKEAVLFGAGAGRVVVSLAHEALGRLAAVAQLAGAPLVVLGAVGGDRLQIQSALSLSIGELSSAWRDEIPSA